MLQDLKLGELYDGFLFLAENRRNPPALKSHHHVELELNLVVRGTIIYIVEGRRYTFTRGTLLWIFPAQEHQLIERSSDSQYYVAVFKPTLIQEACRGAFYAELKKEDVEDGGVVSRRLGVAEFELAKRTMDTLMEGSLDPDLLNREAGFGIHPDFSYRHEDPDALNAGLRYLLILCWRYCKAGSGGGQSMPLHPSVRKALSLLGDGELDLGLEEMAARCGVSAAYLSRVFSNQVGVPLNRYKNALRLSRFMEAYHSSEQKTMLECVYAAGFGSYAQFYKVFAQHYGQGPRQYLRDGTPVPLV